MAVTLSWEFPLLDVAFSEDGYSNVVQRVHWIYTAADGDYKSSMFSTVTLGPPGETFTEYNSLTPQIVQGWVVNTIGQSKIDEMSATLTSNVNSQKTPTGGPLPPPWA